MIAVEPEESSRRAGILEENAIEMVILTSLDYNFV